MDSETLGTVKDKWERGSRVCLRGAYYIPDAQLCTHRQMNGRRLCHTCKHIHTSLKTLIRLQVHRSLMCLCLFSLMNQ